MIKDYGVSLQATTRITLILLLFIGQTALTQWLQTGWAAHTITTTPAQAFSPLIMQSLLWAGGMIS